MTPVVKRILRFRSLREPNGRSDLVDSVAVARIVASGEVLPSAHRVEVLTDLRALVDYRDQLVRARTQLANRAYADLVNVRPGYGREVPNLNAKAHRAKARALLKGDRSVRAELVRRRLGELSRLEEEIAAMDRRLEATVRQTGTSLIAIPGVGPFIAAKILGEVGDLSRVRSKAAFAVLSGTAALPASSGQTHRHRLNRGGNRQLNWALHYIALVQSRITPDAQAYMVRQREAGKSNTRKTQSPRPSEGKRRCGGVPPVSWDQDGVSRAKFRAIAASGGTYRRGQPLRFT